MTRSLRYVVVKFGGTSVAAADSWHMIVTLMTSYLAAGLRPVIVCSALTGISDLLAKLVPELALSNHYQDCLETIKLRHRDFAARLGLDADIILADDFAELARIALGVSLTQESSALLQARTMAFGELMLTKLASAFLTAKGLHMSWQDARAHLVSVDNPLSSVERNILSAYCDYAPDIELQKRFNHIDADIILTQGFIASNSKGQTVLLGRGGSDTSAAYFAAKLQAVRCEIWTDVPGIYTTNPHLVPEARLLKTLGFDEAREIAATGAKVLHPACLDPLARNNIPLSIHCTAHPEWDGTKISNDMPLLEPQVKAISLKLGVVVIAMETTMMWQQVGFLSNVFECFKKHDVSVDLIATSENNVTVALDSTRYHYSVDTLESLVAELTHYCAVEIKSPCAAISLVGRNIRAILHQLASVFELFKEQKMYLITQATNDLNLTFVIDETEANNLLHKIHDLLFEHPLQPKLFSKSWQNAFPAKIPADYWWYEQHDTLIALAKKQTPVFVYNLKLVKERAGQLQKLNNIKRVFYAMKANWHEAVLTLLYQMDFGFECVSQGELERIFALFPTIDPKRVLFTPNFAPKCELEFALKKQVFITLDNVHPLQHWPELFKGSDIMLRIDPGLGRGHHRYVQTGGAHSKFGIAKNQLELIAPILQQHDITVIGLHVHFGSGVLAATSWSETAISLAKLSEQFPAVRILNLGGGLGVAEKFGQPELDLQQLNDALTPICAAYPKVELWLEPGRYLVSEAGVLLAKVTQLKQKEDTSYVGIDAGMNSLIRPMLYSAYHEIVNLSKRDEPRTEIVHIVGPICETGDTLGYSRVMPVCEEGDVILIANCGAYGRVMSSHYNCRAPAEEIVIS